MMTTIEGGEVGVRLTCVRTDMLLEMRRLLEATVAISALVWTVNAAGFTQILTDSTGP